MTDSFHELKCKLLCLTCTAQYAVQQLLALFCQKCQLSNFANHGDVNIALAEILDNYFQKDKLKKLSTLTYPDNEEKIFVGSTRNKTVKHSIAIETLDLTPLVDILKNIPDFPSCKDIYRLHLVCAQCNKPGKKGNAVCCISCNLCTKCSTLCDNYATRQAVNVIHDLRNRAMHITTADCIEIENSQAITLEWKKDINSYYDAIKHVLDILTKYGKISAAVRSDKKFDAKLVLRRNKKVYIDNFLDSLESLLIEIPKTFNRKLTLYLTSSSEKGYLSQLKDIDSDISTVVFYTFKDKIIELLEKELHISSNSKTFKLNMQGIRHDCKAENELSSIVTIHITSVDHDIPYCYTEAYSDEAERLRKQLKNLFAGIISDALMIEVNIICNGYELDSIHLYLTVLRKDSVAWTTEEVYRIGSVINNVIKGKDDLLQELMSNNGLDNFHSSVTFPKSCIERSTLTFMSSLSTGDEELLVLVDPILQTLQGKIDDLINIDTLVEDVLEKPTSKDIATGIIIFLICEYINFIRITIFLFSVCFIFFYLHIYLFLMQFRTQVN